MSKGGGEGDEGVAGEGLPSVEGETTMRCRLPDLDSTMPAATAVRIMGPRGFDEAVVAVTAEAEGAVEEAEGEEGAEGFAGGAEAALGSCCSLSSQASASIPKLDKKLRRLGTCASLPDAALLSSRPFLYSSLEGAEAIEVRVAPVFTVPEVSTEEPLGGCPGVKVPAGTEGEAVEEAAVAPAGASDLPLTMVGGDCMFLSCRNQRGCG